MAVYTKISKSDLDNFLANYKIGNFKKFQGIKDGVENTNYLIQTEKKKFILTIYEKRVDTKELPFFIGLMTNLYNSNFKCPRPIINKNGNYISNILGKKAAIVSFLEGSAKKTLTPQNCYDVGIEVAKLHKITKKLSLNRKNSLSLNSWSELFERVEKDCSKIHKNLPEIIKESLEEIKRNWPTKLPSGIIHADLFPDNIIFKMKNSQV